MGSTGDSAASSSGGGDTAASADESCRGRHPLENRQDVGLGQNQYFLTIHHLGLHSVALVEDHLVTNFD